MDCKKVKIGSNERGLDNVRDDAYIKREKLKGSLNGCLRQAENKVKARTVKFTQQTIFGSGK